MAGVTVQVDFRELMAGLKGAAARANRMTPAWRQVGEVMVGSVRRNFEDGGRPRTWPPTQLSTILGRFGGLRRATTKRRGNLRASVKRKIGREKTLIHTGRLINSVQAQPHATSVEIGTDVIYAGVHQFGWPKRNIPARPFFLVQTPQDEREIARTLESYIMERFR